jgi:predicted transcriptional regulator
MEPLLQASDAELEIMKIIWQSDNRITLGALLKSEFVVNKKWKPNTVVTFLARLGDKELLTIEKKGRNNIYVAAMTEADFRKQKTQTLINDVYHGNTKELVASLLKHESLTQKDIEELTEFWQKGGGKK